MMQDIFQEIWNEAYNIYCECGSVVMRRYLMEQVKRAKITLGDADVMYNDVITTYNL